MKRALFSRKVRCFMAGMPNKSVGRCAVFVHIPKTAGLTVTKTLALEKLNTLTGIRNFFTAARSTSFGHISLVALADAGLVSPSHLKKAFIFTVVRNPYGRAISLFNYLQQVNFYAPPPSEGLQLRAATGDAVVEKAQKDFTRFLETVRDGVPAVGLYNVNGLSQCNRQVDWLKGVDVDFVARYEDLESGLSDISEALYGYRATVRTKNVTRFCRATAQQLLTERSIALIQDIYEEDFRTLGYYADPNLTGSPASPSAGVKRH